MFDSQPELDTGLSRPARRLHLASAPESRQAAESPSSPDVSSALWAHDRKRCCGEIPG